MKRLLLFILFLLPLIGLAQGNTTVGNFKLEDQKLAHVYVYEPTDTVNVRQKVYQQLSMNPQFHNIQNEGNSITAEIKDMKIDYKKYGGKWGNTPAMLNYPINGRLLVEFKDGRYRTIVQGINCYTMGGWAPLEDISLNRAKDSISTVKGNIQVLSYMDKHFVDTFTMKQLATAKDDW